jgi:hypothetical protein
MEKIALVNNNLISFGAYWKQAQILIESDFCKAHSKQLYLYFKMPCMFL